VTVGVTDFYDALQTPEDERTNSQAETIRDWISQMKALARS